MMTAARFRNTDALPSMPSQHHLSSRNLLLLVASNHNNDNDNSSNDSSNIDECYYYDKDPKPPLLQDNVQEDDDESISISDGDITTLSTSTTANHHTNIYSQDDTNSNSNSNSSTRDYLTQSLLSLFRWGSNSNLSGKKVKTKKDKKRKQKKDKQTLCDSKNKQLDQVKQSVSTPCLKVSSSSYHSSNSHSHRSNHHDDVGMDHSHTSHTSAGSSSSFQLSSPGNNVNTIATTSSANGNQRRREMLLQFKRRDNDNNNNNSSSVQSSLMASHNSIKSVSFRDNIQVHSVPDLSATTHRHDLYYSPREIVQMQQEKLQEDAELARQERDRIVHQRKAERQARRVHRQDRLQARRATRIQQLQTHQIQSQQQQQQQSCKALLQTIKQEPTSNTKSNRGDNLKPQTNARRQSLRKHDTPNRPPLSPHHASRRQLQNQCKSTSHIMEHGYGSLSVLDLGDDDDDEDDDDKYDFEKKYTHNKVKNPKSPTNGRRRSALSSSSAWHVSMSALEDTTTITALMKKKDDNKKTTQKYNLENNNDTPPTRPSYSYRPRPLTSTARSSTTSSRDIDVISTQDKQRSQSARAIKVEESLLQNTKKSEIQWSPPPSFASPPTPSSSSSKRFRSNTTTKFIPPAPLHHVPLTPATSYDMEPSPKDNDAESPNKDQSNTTGSKRTTLKKALSLHSVKLSNKITNSNDGDEIQLVGSSSCRSLLSQYSADFKKVVPDTNEKKYQQEEQQQDFWAMIFGNHNPNIIS